MKIYLLIFLSFLPFITIAQLNPKTKWGNVSQEEIDYKEVPFEKEANAVVLFETGDMLVAYQEWGNKIHKRIKILTEQGKEQANYEIVYFNYRNTESILNLRAQTINFENGKKEVSSVKLKDIYDVPHNGYYSTKRFAFPNVKVGSIIELEYTLLNDVHSYIEGWVFQHEIPTLYSSFSADVQVPIDYVPICVGKRILEYNNENKKKHQHKSSWTLTDLPSVEKSDFTYNHNDFAERIDFQSRGYYSQSKGYVTEVTSWSDITKMILDFYAPKTNRKTVQQISNKIKNSDNEYTQVQNVINYVKNNFNWNEEISLMVRNHLSDLEALEQGNSAELNFLLYHLLKSKNIETELILIGLRNHRKLQTAYPYINQFSTIINQVTLQDGTILFVDASYLPPTDFHYMPLRNYNHYGLTLSDKEERFVKIVAPLSEFHTTQIYNVSSDGKFVLTRTDKASGYLKSNESPTKVQHSFKSGLLEITTTSGTEDKFWVTKTLLQSEQVEPFYILQNPLMDVIARYKMEKERDRPLEFDFPIYYKATIILKIPENYHVEIPESFNVHHTIGKNELIFYQNAEVKNGSLVFAVEFLLGKTFYDNQHLTIHDFFEKANLDTAKTILIKKQ
ncbi:MAG: DUF3857 domain-containing protein [Moheibacter sp.]